MQIVAALMLLFAGIVSASAQQATFPNRPISIIVPFAAGGTTDILARIIADGMSRDLGQNVVIENVGGAGGRTGVTRFVRAEPDGYTILFGNTGPMAAAMGMFKDMRYDPRSDFEPLGIVAVVPMVMAVSNKSGVANLGEFLSRLRQQPNSMNFGTAGFGATSDMAPNLFLHLTKLQATIVPYQGAGPAIRDLTAGVIDAVVDQTATLLPVHDGKLAKAIAVTSAQRLRQAPDVPTFRESGLPEFNMSVWNAMVLPKNTPAAVVARLSQSLNAALDAPETLKRFGDLAVPLPTASERGPEPLRQLIAAEVVRWGEVFKDISKQ